MKITKSKLKRIITEELQNILAEQSVDPTVYVGDVERRRERAKEREALKKFFGTRGARDLEEPDTTQMPDAPRAASDPDKTAKLSPARQAALDKEREVIQAPELSLRDPERLTITDFSKDVQDKLLLAYSNKEGISIDPKPLGSGEFGIVYKGENPEWGPVAVKMTLSGREINAYRNIKKLKDGLETRDPQAGNVLPEILDISVLPSPPVGPEGTIRRGKFIEKQGGQKYKVFVIQMELLEKLDPATRSDVFGADPTGKPEPEVRKRFVDNYLAIDNIYSALEKVIGEDTLEKILSTLESPERAAMRRGADPGPVTEQALPIKDERAFPIFREIEKKLLPLKKAYLRSDPENDYFAIQDMKREISKYVKDAFAKYIDDPEALRTLNTMLRYPQILGKQLDSNMRLSQYDPKTIGKSSALGASMLPPSEIKSQVAKNFYTRLKKLEKYDAQYGDVHSHNLMQRPNGDLVVADVGLFLFGPEGSRGYAGSIAESGDK